VKEMEHPAQQLLLLMEKFGDLGRDEQIYIWL